VSCGVADILAGDSSGGGGHCHHKVVGVRRGTRDEPANPQICDDLGYRPSDLLQADCVIWVEGHSDNIYVRRWIELIDPNQDEGIDYSIVFDVGKLRLRTIRRPCE
jgi:hypothetical protein